MDSLADQPNYWQDFRATLKERLRKPCKHPSFVMYFFGIIIFVGSFGLLEPLVSCWVLGCLKSEDMPRALVSATYTYFVAISATAAVDFILSSNKKKHLLMFFVLCSLIVLACFIFAVIYAIFLHRPIAAAIPAAFGYVLALLLWWIGNAENARLLEAPIEPTAPLGADSQPIGDLSGFNT